MMGEGVQHEQKMRNMMEELKSTDYLLSDSEFAYNSSVLHTISSLNQFLK